MIQSSQVSLRSANLTSCTSLSSIMMAHRTCDYMMEDKRRSVPGAAQTQVIFAFGRRGYSRESRLPSSWEKNPYVMKVWRTPKVQTSFWALWSPCSQCQTSPLQGDHTSTPPPPSHTPTPVLRGLCDYPRRENHIPSREVAYKILERACASYACAGLNCRFWAGFLLCLVLFTKLERPRLALYFAADNNSSNRAEADQR